MVLTYDRTPTYVRIIRAIGRHFMTANGNADQVATKVVKKKPMKKGKRR